MLRQSPGAARSAVGPSALRTRKPSAPGRLSADDSACRRSVMRTARIVPSRNPARSAVDRCVATTRPESAGAATAPRAGRLEGRGHARGSGCPFLSFSLRPATPSVSGPHWRTTPPTTDASSSAAHAEPRDVSAAIASLPARAVPAAAPSASRGGASRRTSPSERSTVASRCSKTWPTGTRLPASAASAGPRRRRGRGRSRTGSPVRAAAFAVNGPRRTASTGTRFTERGTA
jgi:hypothetical protein